PCTGATTPIALPGAGTAMVSTPRDHSAQAWITYTDYVTPGTVLHVGVDTGVVTTWATAPGAPAPSSDVLTQQVVYHSHDGTDVRLFIVAKGDASNGPRP